MSPSTPPVEFAANPTDIHSKTVSYRMIQASEVPGEGLRLERGFFFGMVENGTIRETDATGEHLLTAGQLLILSPSRSCTLTDADSDLRMLAIGLNPDFFDTLPDGQLMYGQLARRPDPSSPLRLRPDPEAWRHLRLTAALFADGMAPFPSCRRGIVRHWCGLFLLQITDILHRDCHSATAPISVKRADLLFREFKRLSVEHFRQRHDIGFYADTLHISPTYLSRIVKRTTGHTVYAHLTGLLVAEARRFLESTDMDIKEIADRLGFSDQSSFGKFFKAQSGLSPQHYRQRFGRSAETAEIEKDK
ncbi:helix-turn-helix domain-containing protein [Alistipes sp.]|uniref:AraC family transcriptional regulator n=1 Tax=Alistipes sp. TaxID=1872444 RepID=UPI003A866E7C